MRASKKKKGFAEITMHVSQQILNMLLKLVFEYKMNHPVATALRVLCSFIHRLTFCRKKKNWLLCRIFNALRTKPVMTSQLPLEHML